MDRGCTFVGVLCWAPEVWAAWAQAILSAVAIYFAGRFSMAQHRREIAQRVGAVVAILARASDEAEDLLSGVDGSVGNTSAARWHLDRLDRVGDALDRISVYDLPDERLVMPVLDVGEYVRAFRQLANTIKNKAANNWPMLSTDAASLKQKAKQIANCYDDAIKVDREYRPLTFRQKRKIKAIGTS